MPLSRRWPKENGAPFGIRVAVVFVPPMLVRIEFALTSAQM
jgi:hypothetical protein